MLQIHLGFFFFFFIEQVYYCLVESSYMGDAPPSNTSLSSKPNQFFASNAIFSVGSFVQGKPQQKNIFLIEEPTTNQSNIIKDVANAQIGRSSLLYFIYWTFKFTLYLYYLKPQIQRGHCTPFNRLSRLKLPYIPQQVYRLFSQNPLLTSEFHPHAFGSNLTIIANLHHN